MDWKSVLKKAGYPTTALVLDFETYFDDIYSLKKMSTVEYVCDPRFELTGLGIQVLGEGLGGPGEDTATFILPNKIQLLFEGYVEQDKKWFRNCTIIGQNLKFDCLILKEHFGIVPQYTVDVRDLDRIWDARDSHKLEYMAKKWKAPSLKGDTQRFKGLHWADMDEEKRRELEEYTKKDVEIEAFLFEKLLPLIPNPDTELPLATQTLHLFLNPQIEIDAEMGNKLKRQMTVEELKPLRKLRLTGVICPDCKGADTTYLSYKDGRCERCGGLGKIMNTPLKEISGNLSFVKLLNQELPENEQIPVKPGKNGMIPALAREDEGMRYLLNHQKETVRLLAEARLAIKSWPLHIKRVDNLMEQAGCRGGKIGAPLSYYAGHLGRWGGTEKINLQNLGGRGRGGFDIHPLIGQIRQMLKAPDGFVFGVADFSQIEARVLAWLAEQDDLVQGFAEGRDVYSEFGNESFGWQVRKPKKDDPKPLYQELLIKRGFCKDTILGAGYGMGANKFYRRSYANQNLRPAFDSGEYDWDFINHLIKSYRTRYAMIPRFWQQVEKAWKFVTKYPKETLELPKNLKFWYEDRATFIGLPSDRFIRYPYASINKQDDLLYRWGKLWGGSITENIVQAVARDVMAVSLLRLQDAGYNIVLHVHDEIVCLLNESSASLWLEGMAHLMSSPIEWAVGLPIAVETKLVERYEK